VAPAFHLPIDWSQRIQLGAGTEREGDAFIPRGGWRSPDAGELGLLVSEPARQALADCLCVFQLPQHLRAAWWRLLDRARATGAGHLDGFDAYAADVAAFLAFKELPVPEGAAFDLLVSAAGLRSIPLSRATPGLAFSVAGQTPYPVDDPKCWPRLWGGVNLGDEATALLFLNLPATELLAELRRRRAEPFAPGTLGALADRFLTLCPDYPPVRLRVEPGEGLRLPAAGLIVDGCTLDRTEPDVLLLIRHGGQGGMMQTAAAATTSPQAPGQPT
jgi:hypothetical protein